MADGLIQFMTNGIKQRTVVDQRLFPAPFSNRPRSFRSDQMTSPHTASSSLWNRSGFLRNAGLSAATQARGQGVETSLFTSVPHEQLPCCFPHELDASWDGRVRGSGTISSSLLMSRSDRGFDRRKAQASRRNRQDSENGQNSEIQRPIAS